MPRLACWSCGRTIYSTAPVEGLFPEERRCPRCGAQLNQERRSAERREGPRRQSPPDEPAPEGAEHARSGQDRREAPRRHLGNDGDK